AAVALVLHRHTGSEHPVFGTVVSGRNVAVAQVESTIGPCISTIPCRARIGRALTVGDLLQTLHHDGTAAYDYEHCRLTDIHRWSGMSPEQPLFNVLLAYQNYPEVQSDTDLPIRLSLLDSHDPTDVPLTLVAAHQGTQLYVKAGFQTGVFSTDYVERFVDHLENTIRSLVTASPSDLVTSLSMLTESEHELLTSDWARNPVILPTGSYAHEGFLSCVQSRPGRVAIRDGEQEYTYGQLHLMATHLAHRLHQTGKGGSDQVVGILAGNSVELIVGQLAVWMAGLAFVVIAPDYPVERQQFILADAACVAGFIRTTGMTAEVVTPTLLTPTFDVSLSEIWTTLSVGGRLLITRGDQKRALQQATRAACTPSLVSLFEPSDFPGLHSLVLTGEPSSQALVDKCALVGLAELPRTPVGKVDRKALPPFHFNCSPTDTDLSTLSPVESQLLQTVADCLRLDASIIRLDSTFYQIGGNSLSAIQVVAQCQRNGLHLAIAELNRNNTLRQVARLCAAVDLTSAFSTRPDQEVIGCPRLTPGQLAFFSMSLTHPNQVALPVLFKSSRAFPEVQWRTAVRRMVELHPMLRGLFRRDDQAGSMTYDVGERPLHDHYRFELHPVNDFATVMSMLPSLLLELDIEKGPLSTFHVFDLGHEQYFFHCVHHLASDYLSYKVFAEDLTRLLLDQQVEPPTVSCQAWAEYLHQVAQDLDLDTLTVPPPLPDLAVSLQGEVAVPESTPGGRNPECLVCLDLSPSTLTSAANRFGATPIELLVTTLHVAYQEVFHFNVMGLAFMTHGRQPVGDTAFDLSRTMGFFAHYVPVVLDVPRAAGFRTTLLHTQETLGTGIEDGVKLTLVRYLRDFTDSSQRRPYEVDPYFGFSYLAPTEASVPSDGNQPLLQEQPDAMTELRAHRADTSPRPFELAVTHEGDRLNLLVIGQKDMVIPPIIQRLLGVWSETVRQMVETPDST
ncbi:hypothetical protein IWQ60_006277, partial [Tieghemiomyces parasiticus]